jgi:hypothetical protein
MSRRWFLSLLFVFLLLAGLGALFLLSPLLPGARAADQSRDGLVFIHHSVGANWLAAGLDDALLAKPYVQERNDIYYGTRLAPDKGRPASLGAVPGDFTDMDHWILWFNDYLLGVKGYHNTTDLPERVLRRFGIRYDSGTFNRIVMFKSCYPLSDIAGEGTAPGDPFSPEKTLANYQALYRHAAGPGHSYTREGYTYYPLEEIFAANPDVLFIAVTSPPLHYAPDDATNDANAARARQFTAWLKNEWLPAYNAANPGVNNVAIFDLFDVLANPAGDPEHPNRLQAAYGGESGDSHPNWEGNRAATTAFAAGPNNFLDEAWRLFMEE